MQRAISRRLGALTLLTRGGGLWILILLQGCTSPRDARPFVSSELESRVQHSVNSNPKPSERDVPPEINVQDGISEDEAVAIALWNNATFNETLTKLGFARADLAAAGLLSNPTFSILFPLGPKQLEFTAKFTLESLWVRPKRVTLARLEQERVAQALVQSGIDLVRDVRLALIEFNLARKRNELAQEAVKLKTRIEELSQARVRAGDLSELEASLAKTDVMHAQEEARRMQHQVKLAEATLLHLLGLEGDYSFFPATTLPSVTENRNTLERKALAARPDLRAAEIGIEAAGQRAGLAKAEIFAISGIIDANGSGSEGFEIGPGLETPLPIFNRNQAGIARARAELERASWNYAAVQDRIRLEVGNAFMRQAQARESAETLEKQILPSLEETVRQAQQAYELGNVSLLLVYEQTRQLLTARVEQAVAAADLQRAWAELQRCVGTNLTPEDRQN